MGKVRFCEMSSPPEKRHTVSLLAPLARRKKLWRRGGVRWFWRNNEATTPPSSAPAEKIMSPEDVLRTFRDNSNGSWFKQTMAIASSRARSSARTWRVLAMSKILWTKQRLDADRTLFQLVEGCSYCVVYTIFGVSVLMILSKPHVTLTIWFGKKNVQFWGGNQKMY